MKKYKDWLVELPVALVCFFTAFRVYGREGNLPLTLLLLAIGVMWLKCAFLTWLLARKEEEKNE